MTTHVADLTLSCELRSVTVARHFVRDQLLTWRLERLVEDAELGVSELVANAVKHARTPLELSVVVGDRATFSVTDGHPVLRSPVGSAHSDALAESGRGLQIIAAIANDWGIRALPEGKRVWFSLPLPDLGTADATYYRLADHRAAGRSHRPDISAAGHGS
jgi:anti-sigma regulatory factor (Ser/Thr protein kinase)